MASKSKSPPSASSSEEEEQDPAIEEEEEEQSEDEDSGEEEEEPKTAPPPEKRTQKPLQTPQQKSHSSESDGSGSDSDADSGQSQQPSPSASDFHVKPNVPTAPTSKSSTKRPSQKEKESRSRKKPKIVAEEEEKKSSTATPNSSKLWNDEDQIALLKGMVEFNAQKGSESFDMSDFHDFIKGKLLVEVSKSQISDKIKRLKKKLLTALKTGDDPIFTKPDDYLIFELSKKIWAPAKGNANNGVTENVNANGSKGKKTAKSAEPKKSGKVSTSKEDKKQVTVKEGGDFESKYPRLAKSFSMVEFFGNCVDMYMSSIPDEKAKVLEEKWKKLEDEEHVLLAKRLELITEHVKLVVGAKIASYLALFFVGGSEVAVYWI